MSKLVNVNKAVASFHLFSSFAQGELVYTSIFGPVVINLDLSVKYRCLLSLLEEVVIKLSD